MSKPLPSPVRPLLVSTSDIQGGASRASYRLHEGLQSLDIESRMVSFNRISGDPTVVKIPSKLAVQQVKLSGWLDKQPLELYRRRQTDTFWSLNWFPNTMAKQINSLNPNIVHLHWIGNGFIPIRALRHIKTPIVWTLHDMWPLTGGCHYAGECTGYKRACGRCPQLGSNSAHDLSWWTLQSKRNHWKNLDLTIITPSKWLAECARSSTVFANARIEVIPNGLSLKHYRTWDKVSAREILQLPKEKKLILAGAHEGLNDQRKGGRFIKPALQHFVDLWGADSIELVIFGGARPDSPQDLGLPTHYIGHFHDDISLALLYSAVDVFVAPSVQDNLPNTIMEALACGTPCVAFNIGGIPDMIDHQKNGYLVTPYDVKDLAAGIQWVLENQERYTQLSVNARKSAVDRFEMHSIASSHLDLYQDILAATSKAR